MTQKTTPAYCETCKKYTPTNQIARVTDLPQILSINCELTNENEMNFLKKQMNRNSATPTANEPNIVNPSTSTPIKPCRYGTNCSRVDCHFAHSDRKSPAVSIPTCGNTITKSNIWFPHQFTMEIDNDTNELKITSEIDTGDVDDESNESKSKPNENNPSIIESKLDQLTMDELTIVENDISKSYSKVVYKLSAVVCQIINGNQKNLVALIRVGEQYHKAKLAEYDCSAGQWYIFNDFSIASVSEQEAVWFTLDWKVPCVLFYSSEEIIAHESNVMDIEANLDNPFIHVIK